MSAVATISSPGVRLTAKRPPSTAGWGCSMRMRLGAVFGAERPLALVVAFGAAPALAAAALAVEDVARLAGGITLESYPTSPVPNVLVRNEVPPLIRRAAARDLAPGRPPRTVGLRVDRLAGRRGADVVAGAAAGAAGRAPLA